MHRRVALTVLLVLAVSACTPAPDAGPGDSAAGAAPGTAPEAVPTAEPLHPGRVALPPDALPELAVPWGDAVLVGVVRPGADAAGYQPGLLRVEPVDGGVDGATGTETVAEVPLAPVTGYGRSASWMSLAADGERVVGVGADRGGAHGNPRWSVWSGTDAGVEEHEQAFSTFGGWGAGQLVDVVASPAGPQADALVGSWQGDLAGLDVAVWARSAEGSQEWARLGSAGTPLQGTRASVVAALAAAPAPDGMLVAGWVYGTAPGGTQVPVVWRAPGPQGPWTREPLPDAGARGSAMAVRCADRADRADRADGTCVVAGHVDGVLALWRRDGGGWTRVAGVPPLAVDESARLPAPLLRPDGVDQVAADGGLPAVVRVTWDAASDAPVAPRAPSAPAAPASGATGVTLALVDGPPAPAVSAAVVGGRLYLVTGSVPRTGTVSGTASGSGTGSGTGSESGADPSAAAALPPAELWSVRW